MSARPSAYVRVLAAAVMIFSFLFAAGASADSGTEGIGVLLTLASSKNPSMYGETVKFTATVTGLSGQPPTGTVAFMDSATVLDTVEMNFGNKGVVSYSTNKLDLGRHGIYAVFVQLLGPPLPSNTISQQVKKATTTTTITTGDPTLLGTPWTAKVKVTGKGFTPTGKVTLTLDAVEYDTADLVNGSASWTFDGAILGHHQLGAMYYGDFNHQLSNSVMTEHIVTNTQVEVVTSPNPTNWLQPHVHAAVKVTTINPELGIPQGKVSVNAGADACTAVLMNGEGLCELMLTGGVYKVRAYYEGHLHHLESAGYTTQVVESRPLMPTKTTIMTHFPNPSFVYQDFEVSFFVMPDIPEEGSAEAAQGAEAMNPTGSVKVKTSDGQSCTGAIVIPGTGVGSCVLKKGFALPGQKWIQATYLGDMWYDASASEKVEHLAIGERDISETTLAAAPNPADFGAEVTLTATIKVKPPVGDPKNDPIPTGLVRFVEGETELGTVNVGKDGTAVLKLSTLAAGKHSIVAAYSGDEWYLPSISCAVDVVINPPPPPPPPL